MIVIARGYGQLGNRLFLYAHTIAAACEYNTQVANPCFAEYAHLFSATANDLWCRYPIVVEAPAAEATVTVETQPTPSLRMRKFVGKATYLNARLLSWSPLSRHLVNVIRLRGDETCDLGSEHFAQLAQQDRLLLAQGWLFRSNRLVEKHAAAIRQHFEILPEHRRNVDQAIKRMRSTADVLVGVHIRHGDYATFMNGRYFYSVQQYAAAMQRIVDALPNKRVAFLVCSNAKIASDDFEGLQVHFGPGHIVEDMYCFAEADFLIGPPSTYTGWASFYGDVPLCSLESADQAIDVSVLETSRRQVA